MHVVEIEIQDGQSRYVVINEAGELVGPIVRYLKYLDCIGSARLTLRSYAYSLMHYWEYLTQQHLDWQQVTLDDLSRFVRLRSNCPPGHSRCSLLIPFPRRVLTGPLIMLSRWYGAFTITTGGWKRSRGMSKRPQPPSFPLAPGTTNRSCIISPRDRRSRKIF